MISGYFLLVSFFRWVMMLFGFNISMLFFRVFSIIFVVLLISVLDNLVCVMVLIMVIIVLSFCVVCGISMLVGFFSMCNCLLLKLYLVWKVW